MIEKNNIKKEIKPNTKKNKINLGLLSTEFNRVIGPKAVIKVKKLIKIKNIFKVY